MSPCPAQRPNSGRAVPGVVPGRAGPAPPIRWHTSGRPSSPFRSSGCHGSSDGPHVPPPHCADPDDGGRRGGAPPRRMRRVARRRRQPRTGTSRPHGSRRLLRRRARRDPGRPAAGRPAQPQAARSRAPSSTARQKLSAAPTRTWSPPRRARSARTSSDRSPPWTCSSTRWRRRRATPRAITRDAELREQAHVAGVHGGGGPRPLLRRRALRHHLPRSGLTTSFPKKGLHRLLSRYIVMARDGTRSTRLPGREHQGEPP